MKTRMNRMVSLLLTIVMLWTMLPTGAFASEVTDAEDYIQAYEEINDIAVESDAQGAEEYDGQEQETPALADAAYYDDAIEPHPETDADEHVPAVSGVTLGEWDEADAEDEDEVYEIAPAAEPLKAEWLSLPRYGVHGVPFSAVVAIEGGAAPYACVVNGYTASEEDGAFKADVTPDHSGSYEIEAEIVDALGETIYLNAALPVSTGLSDAALDWRDIVGDLVLTGDAATDLVAVAYSQLGYAVSEDNFIITEDGAILGYTRYGDWAGDAYGEWNAAFVEFCLEYANIPEKAFPRVKDAAAWASALGEMYRNDVETYAPKAGDIAFFDRDGDGAADGVGIVTVATEDTVYTLEGGRDGAVKEYSYARDDAQIAGYGSMPEKADTEEEASDGAGEDDDLIEASGDADDLEAEVLYDPQALLDSFELEGSDEMPMARFVMRAATLEASDAETPDDHDISIDTLRGTLRAGAMVQGGKYVWNVNADNNLFLFRVAYSISGTRAYEPGQVVITVPKSILVNRYGNSADKYDLALPHEDDAGLTSDNVFVYREDGDKLVIYNRIEADAGQTGYFEIAYHTNDGLVNYVDYGAEGSASNPFSATMTITQGDVTQEKSTPEIPVYINTDARVSGLRKGTPALYESWDEEDWDASLKIEGDDAGEYFYLMWPVVSSVNATQLYDYTLTDNLVDVEHGSVVGYRMSGEYIVSAQNHVKNAYEGNRWNQYRRTDYVLTRHDKAYYDELFETKGRYTIENAASGYLVPVDGVDAPSSASGKGSYTVETPVFVKPVGSFQAYKWGNDYRNFDTRNGSWQIRNYQLDDFVAENIDAIEDLRYHTWMHGYAYPFTVDQNGNSNNPADYGKKYVIYELEDDKVYLKAITSSAYTGPLTAEDYEFTSIQLELSVQEVTGFDNKTQKFVFGAPNYEDDQIEIYLKINGGEFALAAVYNAAESRFENVNASLVVSYNDSSKTLIPAENCTGYKLVDKNKHFYTRLGAYPVLTLKDSATVRGVVGTSDDPKLTEPKISVKNEASMEVTGEPITETEYDYDGEGNEYSYTYSWTPEYFSGKREGVDYIVGFEARSEIDKEAVAVVNDKVRRQHTVTWEVDAFEWYDMAGRNYIEQSSGTFYDLLPIGSAYKKGSIEAYAVAKLVSTVSNEDDSEGSDGFITKTVQLEPGGYSIRTIENYNGTGRTLLIVDFNTEGDVYRFTYQTITGWDSVKDHGANLLNSVAYETGNESIGEGFPDNGGNITERALLRGLDPDCNGKKRFIYAEGAANLNGLTAASLQLSKTVRAQADTGYSYKTVVHSGETYAYRLRFANDNSATATNLILFDSLENYTIAAGANTGRTSEWRGSLSGVDVSQARSKGIDPVVYYSTQSLNIEELGIDNNYAFPADKGWVKADNYTGDLAEVKTVAIDLRRNTSGGAYTLPVNASVYVAIYMTAPEEVTSQEVDPKAYNNVYLYNTVKNTGTMVDTTDLTHQDYTTVSFRVMGDLTFKKLAAEDGKTPVPKVEFQLQGTSDYGTKVDMTAVSRRDGSVTFEEIERGTYYLVELGGNPDYQVDGVARTVRIDENGAATLFDADGTENSALIVLNEPRIHGDLTFAKQGTVDFTYTRANLTGAKFMLSGTSNYGNDILKLAESRGGRVTIRDIEWGTYELVEIEASEGYRLDDKTVYTVVCDEYGNVKLYLKNEYYGYLSSVEVITNESLHRFRLKKYDEENNLKYLEGATFNLTGVSDYGTPVDMTVTSNQYGTVVFEGLETGSYILRETEAPEHFELDDTPRAVSIQRNGNVTIEGLNLWNSDLYKDYFAVPNARKREGVVTVVKRWDDDGAANRPVPVVQLDTNEDKSMASEVTISKAKWKQNIGYNNGINGNGNGIALSAAKTFTRNIDKSFAWLTANAVKMDDEETPYSFFVWREGYDFYWWSDADTVYLPEDSSSMFYAWDCSSLDLSEFDASRVKNLNYCFGDPSLGYLQYLNVAGWDTSNVETMERTFANNRFKSLDVNHWNTSKVTNMRGTFYQAGRTTLTSLDLSNWDTSNVEYMAQMFYLDQRLTTIYVGDKWSISKLKDHGTQMFVGDERLVGQNGTRCRITSGVSWRDEFCDARWAHVDTPSNPGYLSYKASTRSAAVPAASRGASAAAAPAMSVAPAAQAAETMLARAAGDDDSSGEGPGEGESESQDVPITYSAVSNSDSVYRAAAGEDTSEIYETWIDNGDDTWTYRFRVFDGDADYYVWEKALRNYSASYYDGSGNPVSGGTVHFEYHEGDDGEGMTHITRAIIVNTWKDEPDPPQPEPESGVLQVKKTLEPAEGGALTTAQKQVKFSFDVTLENSAVSDGDYLFGSTVFSFVGGQATATMQAAHGQTVRLPGIPKGTTYTVIEQASNDYAIEKQAGDSGVIAGGKTSAAVFTNRVKESVLEITKALKSGEDETAQLTREDLEKAFSVRINLSQALTGVYGDAVFKNGTAIIVLKGGETKTVRGLLNGVGYTIEELDGEGYTVAYENKSGTLDYSVKKAAITNTKERDDTPVGGFTLTKRLYGEDSGDRFAFLVELTGLTAGRSYHYTFGEQEHAFTGKRNITLLEFALARNESVTFADLPEGVAWRVIESANDYAASYTVTWTDGNGVEKTSSAENDSAWTELSTSRDFVRAGETVEAVFTNIGESFPIMFAKYDGTNGTDDMPLLEGAVLQVLDAATQGVVAEWTTDYDIQTVRLPAGSYLLHEKTPPEGFKPAEDIPFTVERDGTLKVDGTNMDYAIMVDDEYTQIAVNKVNEKNEPLAGARLEIRDADGNMVFRWTSDGQPREITGKLSVGEAYTLVETQAPTGYKIAEPIEFALNEAGELVVGGRTVANNALVMADEPRIQVRVRKVDQSGSPVVGASLQIQKADGTVVESFTSTDAAQVFDDLEPGSYKLVELEAPEGYLPAEPVPFTVDSAKGTSIDVEMVDVAQTTSITVSKTWDDDNDRDGKRSGVSAKVTLKKTVNGTTTNVETVAVGKTDGWSKTWSGLPRYEDGKAITYSVVETLETANGYVSDTVSAVDVANGGTRVIKNTHTPETTSITVMKSWDDNNDQDGKRSGVLAKVTLKKTVNGTTTDVETVSVGTADGWSKAWNDLPVYEGGKAIVYSVVETFETANGYVSDTATAVSVANGATKTITNRHAPETTTVEGVKSWDDANDQDGKRPESVTIHLYADNVLKDSRTVTAADNWKYEFKDLPKYRSQGTGIVYTVEEAAVAGYTAAVTGYNVKNTHVPETITVNGEKTWEDAENRDGARPASVTINLLANGEKVKSQSVAADRTGKWRYEFTDLPKYRDGEEIAYTVTEDVVTGYTATVTGYDVKNTHVPETTKVEGAKTWDDANNQDGKRPESIMIRLYADSVEVADKTVTAADQWKWSFDDLPKYAEGKVGVEIAYTVVEDAVAGYTATITGYNVKNTHVPETTKVEGAKTWDDANNQDGKRPESITIRLYANGAEVASKTVTAADDWKYQFKDLPKYKDGQEIVYSVGEDAVALYETEVTGHNVKNTYAPEKTSVSGTKRWDDANDQDGKRPGSITIRLYANGVEKASRTVTASDDWKYEFRDLPRYSGGEEIAYSVTEDEIPGYTTEISGYDVTNRHAPEETSVTAAKEWADVPTGVEKPEIWFQLYRSAGSAAAEAVGEPVKVNGEDCTWGNLPVNYGAGQAYVYSVKEVMPDGEGWTAWRAEGYSKTENGLKVTNTYRAEGTTAEIRVSKQLAGRAWKAGESYAFTIENDPNRNAPMPEERSVAITADSGKADGTVLEETFGPIAFTREQLKNEDGSYAASREFYYIIRERKDEPAKGGVTYDTASHRVTVTLTDDGKGALSAAVKYPEGSAAAFVNRYTAKPTSFELEINKLLNGEPTGGYSFGLYDNNGSDAELRSGIRAAAGKNAHGALIGTSAVGTTGSFSGTVTEIEFTKPGTYRYQLKEINDNKPGVTYDAKTVDVTVTVTDDGEGQLASSVSYGTNAGPQDAANAAAHGTLTGATFENTYNATGTAVMHVDKHIAGREWLDSDSFTFTLTGVDGAPVRTSAGGATVANVTTTATRAQHDPSPNFPTLHYQLSDLGGETEKVFTYKVSETSEMPGGMTKAADREIKVKVSDAAHNGVLTVSYAAYDSATGAFKDPMEWNQTMDAPDMVNIYTITDEKAVTLRAAKAITNQAGAEVNTWIIAGEHDWSASEFAFVLLSTSADTPMPEGAKARTDGRAGRYARSAVNASLASGKLASFGEIKYTKPGTYLYNIREVRADKKADANAEGYVKSLYIDDHLIYSTTAHAVTVVVADNGDGKLADPVVTYGAGAAGSATPSVFHNEEQGDAELVLAGRKQLNGKALEAGMFQFELYRMNGANDTETTDEKRIDTGTVTADGMVKKVVEFNLADLNGADEKTFYFAGKEVQGVNPGMTYSQATHRYAVTVTKKAGDDTEIEVTKLEIDDGSGTFAEVALTTDAATGQKRVASNDSWPVHTNTYQSSGTAVLDASKHIQGRNYWNNGESYTFELTGENGAQIHTGEGDQAKLTATATADNRKVDFPDLLFTQADMLVGGSYVTERELTYRIHEKAPDGASDNGNGTWTKDGITSAPDVLVRVKLTDDGRGNITATYRGRDENGQETWLNTPINPQFGNTYQIVGEVRANLGAYKRLAGRAWQAGDSFAFKLRAVTADAPMPESDTLSIAYAAGDSGDTKQGSFGSMLYTKPGVYEYEIEELPGNIPGVSYAAEKRGVKVTVADDGKGGLKTPEVVYTATGDDTPARFENTYAPREGTSFIPTVQKTMKGRGLIAGHYQFDLYAANEAFEIAGEAIGSCTADGTGAGAMNALSYGPSEAGTYYYVIRERVPEDVTRTADRRAVKEGVTYSAHESRLTVVVGDDATTGMLAVKSAVYDNSDAWSAADRAVTDRAAFTNEYSAEGEAEVKVTKVFDDEAGWDRVSGFSFTLEPEADSPMRVKDGESVSEQARLTATATKDAPEAAFDKLYFALEDAGKTYDYTLREVVPEDAHENRKNGITYDPTAIAVSIAVTDGGSGSLSFSILYDGKPAAEITNRYETVTVSGEKTWDDADNRDGLRPASVTIYLLANGARIDSQAVAMNAGGKWAYEFTDLPKYGGDGREIIYTVLEEAVQGYTPEITGYDVKNVHTPETITVSGEKRWDDADDQDGLRPASVTIRLLADDAEIDSRTMTAADDWKYEFRDLPKYREGEIGKPVAYSIAEEAVPGYTPEITGYDVRNAHVPETTAVSVSKRWQDREDRDRMRPQSVRVRLLANGEAARTATLSGANGWQYTWEDLDKYADGVEIEYTVEEIETGVVTGTDGRGSYAWTVTGDAAAGYVLTNTHTPDTTATVRVAKKLTGRDWKAGEDYAFEITSSQPGAPMPAEATTRVTADKAYPDGTTLEGAFGEIAFTREHLKRSDGSYASSMEYNYLVKETAPAGGKRDGVSYATAAHSVRITLTDDGAGTLNAAVTYYNGGAEPEAFVNEYSAEPTGFAVRINKLLNGRPAGGYSFGLYDGDTLIGTSTVDASGVVEGAVPGIRFTAPGTYRYQLKELDDGKPGVRYDTRTVNVTVTVTDDGEGHLVSSVSYDPQKPDYEGATFENSYSATGMAELMVDKHISGREWQDGDRFTFTLTGVDGAPVRTSAEGASAGSATSTATKADVDVHGDHIAAFPALHYALSDLSGQTEKVFTYKVSETSTMPGGMTKAEDREIRVKVSDAAHNGVLAISYAAYDEETGEIAEPAEWLQTMDAPDMVNVYTVADEKAVTLKAVKAIMDKSEAESDSWMIDGEHDWSDSEFAFVLLSTSEDTPMPEGAKARTDGSAGRYARTEMNASLASDKRASFGEIVYTKPGTYYYDIREVRADKLNDLNTEGYVEGLYIDDHLVYSTTAHAVRVEVGDNGDGRLSEPEVSYGASGSAEPSVFHNEEQGDAELVLAGRKQLNGKALEAGMFQFELYRMESAEDKALTEDKRIDTGTVTASGLVEKALEFNLADLEGANEKVFYFAGREIPGDNPAIAYSEAIHRYAVTVTKKAGDDTGIEVMKLEIDDGSGTFKEVELTMDEATGQKRVASNDSWPVHTNTYRASGTATLDASKHIEGRDYWNEGERYAFELTGEDGAPIHTDAGDKEKLTAEATAENRIADFPELWFTEADMGGQAEKEFTYRIHEVCLDGNNADINPPEGGAVKDGVTYAPDHTITVKLTDDGRGNLKATYRTRSGYTNTPINPQFDNRYAIDGEVEAKIEVSKTLVGRGWQAGDHFEFRLAAITEGAPMPGSDTLSIAYAAGDAADTKRGSFGAIVLTKPGVYEYEVEELPGDIPGVSYDAAKHRVTVTVEDDGKGGLTTPETVYAAGTAADFVNRYEATGTEYTPVVKKRVKGGTVKAGAYSFAIYAADESYNVPDGAEALYNGTANESGDAPMHTLRYDAAGEYCYVIREAQPTGEGVSQDGDGRPVKDGVRYATYESRLRVTVTDDGTGALITRAEYDNTSATDAADREVTDRAVFTNEYRAEGTTAVFVRKLLADEGWQHADSFEFELAPAEKDAKLRVKEGEQVVERDRLRIAVTDGEPAAFGELYFDQDDAGKTHAYTITEIAPEDAEDNRKDGIVYNAAPVAVTIAVTDEGDGSLSFEILYDGEAGECAVIENGWEPEDPEIRKTVNDKAHEDLKTRTEVFTYKIETRVPERSGLETFVITDTLESVLEFVDTEATVSVTVDGAAVTGAAAISGKTLTVTLPVDRKGAEVVVSFEAKITEGADLSAYAKETVPNTASYTIDNEPKVDSNTVTVTPPEEPEDPEIRKTVNDREHADLKTRTEVFTYKIETRVPERSGLKTFAIEDKLESVLEFVDTEATVSVTVDGTRISGAAAISGKTLTVTMPQTYLADAYKGKPVVVSFKARIVSGANLSAYANNRVPNKASYQINNDPKVDSNTVTVTPPSPTTTTNPPGGGGGNPNPTPTPRPTTEVSGSKIWNDQGDMYGVRPESVTIELLADGEVADSQEVTGEGDTWTFEFTGLPEYDPSGAAIEYTVREVPVQYYESSVDGTTITNTLEEREPIYTKVEGVKTWNDNDNADGKRPDSITVWLYRDGEKVDSRTVLEANGWRYSFEDLMADNGYGATYTYTVREDAVPGYFQRIEGYDITNTRLPEPPPTPDEPRRRTPPEFGSKTEEELEGLVELFDYDTPLWGGLLGTGDDTPVYPYIFGGAGFAAAVALAVLALVQKKKKGKRNDVKS